MSSIGKFLYSLSDREFYETLDAYRIDEAAFVKPIRDLLSDEWSLTRHGIWMNCIPSGCTPPFQGWKIHVSCSRGAVDLLRAVVPILAEERVAFKFAADPNLLFLLSSKQWYRGGAGKFVTIYPQELSQFLRLIDRLSIATQGFEGPYVLSDRRYENSRCVFYRYGGIAPRTALTIEGDRMPYILSPDNKQIPDTRLAWFALPDWVQDPFGNASLSTQREKTLKNGRYVIESALRFSNSGGLYLATDRETEVHVVLKEARPCIVLDNAGNDAIGMLKKEYRLLQKLESSGIAPRPVDFFQEWEHQFLVEEYLEGMTMRQHAAAHNVTRPTNPTIEWAIEFYSVFRDVFCRLAHILDVLQEHRIVFRDLSPSNVMVLTNGEVRLLDFEAACEQGVDSLCGLFTPGFASADHFNGDEPQFENDYYSLGALMLSYLMPVHAVLTLDPGAGERFVKAITTDFGLPTSLCRTITSLMRPNPSERPSAPAVIKQLNKPSAFRTPAILSPTPAATEAYNNVVSRAVDYISSTATPDREDRLFPADPKIFVTNPLSVAYGACGVAYALKRIAGTVPNQVMDWIVTRDISAETYPPGLYIGLAGIAWTFLKLGLPERAEQVLRTTWNHPLLFEASDLFYGLAGWGMAHLYFYQSLGDRAYLEKAIDAAERLVATRHERDTGDYWKNGDDVLLGMAHGSAGVSLFLLYLYLVTKDSKFLRHGEAALSFDLNHAIENGQALSWPNREGGPRSIVPYWRYGSAGIGTATLRYYWITRDRKYKSFLDGILRDVDRKYAIFPGRFFGLAGLGEFLLDLAQEPEYRNVALDSANKVASGVMLFGIDKGSRGIAFPGFDLWKITCDYATGGAGIALFLDRMRTYRPADFMLDELIFNDERSRRAGTASLKFGKPADNPEMVTDTTDLVNV